VVLLRLLVDGRMTVEEFEVVFLPLYKNDATSWSPEIFDVLENLFANVDDYCADAKLRTKVGGLDDEELRHRAVLSYRRLNELAD
jgi:hypothetical protein